jgi:hypothetical protein
MTLPPLLACRGCVSFLEEACKHRAGAAQGLPLERIAAKSLGFLLVAGKLRMELAQGIVPEPP